MAFHDIQKTFTFEGYVNLTLRLLRGTVAWLPKILSEQYNWTSYNNVKANCSEEDNSLLEVWVVGVY